MVMRNSRGDRYRVVIRAIELLERHGWLQASYGNTDSGFCAKGAIAWAAREQAGYCHREFADSICKDLMAQIDPRGWRWAWSVPNWNDDRRRTKTEVIRELRTLADRLNPITLPPPTEMTTWDRTQMLGSFEREAILPPPTTTAPVFPVRGDGVHEYPLEN